MKWFSVLHYFSTSEEYVEFLQKVRQACIDIKLNPPLDVEDSWMRLILESYNTPSREVKIRGLGSIENSLCEKVVIAAALMLRRGVGSVAIMVKFHSEEFRVKRMAEMLNIVVWVTTYHTPVWTSPLNPANYLFDLMFVVYSHFYSDQSNLTQRARKLIQCDYSQFGINPGKINQWDKDNPGPRGTVVFDSS